MFWPRCGAPEFHGTKCALCSTGLANDYDAVKNSLIYPEISNGPLEGVNRRIKMKHRRAGGRAGMGLLNAYNVLRAENLTA